MKGKKEHKAIHPQHKLKPVPFHIKQPNSSLIQTISWRLSSRQIVSQSSDDVARPRIYWHW